MKIDFNKSGTILIVLSYKYSINNCIGGYEVAIEWFNADKGIPTVTVAKYGINLNAAANEYFVKVAKVKLGFDRKLRKIYIQPCEKNDAVGVNFPYSSEGLKSVRISCRDFIQLVSLTFEIDVSTSEKYYAVWDAENSMLVVELNKKLSRNEGKEKIKL